jgi:hypothetical protein
MAIKNRKDIKRLSSRMDNFILIICGMTIVMYAVLAFSKSPLLKNDQSLLYAGILTAFIGFFFFILIPVIRYCEGKALKHYDEMSEHKKEIDDYTELLKHTPEELAAMAKEDLCWKKLVVPVTSIDSVKLIENIKDGISIHERLIKCMAPPRKPWIYSLIQKLFFCKIDAFDLS